MSGKAKPTTTKATKTPTKHQQAAAIGILIAVIVIAIVYVIVIFECYRTHSFIFTPYQPKAPPSNQQPFHPLGNVTPLTQEEIDHRQRIIKESTGNTSVAP